MINYDLLFSIMHHNKFVSHMTKMTRYEVNNALTHFLPLGSGLVFWGNIFRKKMQLFKTFTEKFRCPPETR